METMETTAIPNPRSASFEDVWAILRENAEQQKEIGRLIKELREDQKETDRLMKENAERQKENAERQKENAERQRKTDEQMKRTNEQIGDLHNRFGELAEHLVAPGINERFNELGYHFDEEASGGVKLKEDGKVKAEIDLLLQNDDTVMAVEVKATVKIKDIEKHIGRLEILRDHRRKKKDLRQVEGAIAGAIFGAAEKKATIEAGLYVIEQSGDTMKIEVPDDFVPRKW